MPFGSLRLSNFTLPRRGSKRRRSCNASVLAGGGQARAEVVERRLDRLEVGRGAAARCCSTPLLSVAQVSIASAAVTTPALASASMLSGVGSGGGSVQMPSSGQPLRPARGAGARAPSRRSLRITRNTVVGRLVGTGDLVVVVLGVHLEAHVLERRLDRSKLPWWSRAGSRCGGRVGLDRRPGPRSRSSWRSSPRRRPSPRGRPARLASRAQTAVISASVVQRKISMRDRERSRFP